MKFTGKDGQLRIYERLGDYVEVRFSNMDFTASIGRPKVDEKLVLDRGNVNTYGHYIKGNDQVIFDPTALSFSCSIDDVTHVNTTNGWKEVVYQALTCRDARNDQSATTWFAYGSSTKGQYENKAGQPNPRFEQPTGPAFRSGIIASPSTAAGNSFFAIDGTVVNGELADCMMKMTSGVYNGKYFLIRICSDNVGTPLLIVNGDIVTAGIVAGDTCEFYPNYRTVDMEYKLNGTATDIVWAFREVYFPTNEIVFTESEESLTLTATGGVYGPVVRGLDWIPPINTL